MMPRIALRLHRQLSDWNVRLRIHQLEWYPRAVIETAPFVLADYETDGGQQRRGTLRQLYGPGGGIFDLIELAGKAIEVVNSLRLPREAHHRLCALPMRGNREHCARAGKLRGCFAEKLACFARRDNEGWCPMRNEQCRQLAHSVQCAVRMAREINGGLTRADPCSASMKESGIIRRWHMESPANADCPKLSLLRAALSRSLVCSRAINSS